MRLTKTRAAAALAISATLALSACGGGSSNNAGDGGQTSGSDSSQGSTQGGNSKDVEVFTWWAAGGEKAGLDGMVSVFDKQCSQYHFVNAAVAGGGGDKAKTLLANNLEAGNPPSTFQAHAGGELTDYIANNQVQDITSLFKENGFDKAFPQDLVDQLTVNGKIYSVPANIHRANMVWVNPKVLKKAGINPNQAPASVQAWISDLAKLKKAGVEHPLAMSKGFAEEMLMETTLLGDLGVDKFNGLWDGSTKWDSKEVTSALNDFKTLMSYTNSDRDTMDWDAALAKYVFPKSGEAQAGYQVMGDWVPAQLMTLNVPDSAYTYWPAPGTDGVYQWLSDSFTLPVNGKDPEGAKCWLKVVGSAEGQKAFNTKKGSIPARTDANPKDYPKYQQWAMKQWKSSKLAPSMAHGSAGPGAWNNDIQTAMSAFSSNPDVGKLQGTLVTLAQKYSSWKKTLG
ncbi:MAG TPA: extracellular solute-binding protein [Segeticoccus sp.]|uniref:ABC transporter substrate-binding protein n=1 Tax=Segeticoccus sp. TaxID=2706531 RepID=UPI002D7F5F1F|nr:extracellular solute-binding protein [Segeticoccus sp.]HET8602105.1 extracellular solute-binding protein [Segeticoccus sp.]